MPGRIAARGAWGTVEWAQDARGQEPAFTFFEGQEAPDQAKILALFQMLAETGRIPNREKFKSLGERGLGLFEFKSFQLRVIGDFRPGRRFVVANGLRKKRGRTGPGRHRDRGPHPEGERPERGKGAETLKEREGSPPHHCGGAQGTAG